MVIKRWPGRPPRARHTTPMISLDRLVCRAYAAQALKRRSVKIPRSQPACRQHQRPRVQLEDCWNAFDRKVLQKTPVLAMAQVQTCRRFRKSTKAASEPLIRGLISPWNFGCGRRYFALYILRRYPAATMTSMRGAGSSVERSLSMALGL